MNYLSFIVVTLVVAASIAWTLWGRRRFAPNFETLLSQLRKPSDREVGNNSSFHLEEQRAKDDRLWAAIHGTTGLYRMFHNSGILLTLATRMNEESGEYQSETHLHNSDLALMLRWALFIGLLECWLLNCFPRLPIPRFIARFAFDQYCELCAAVRAMIEFQYPTLVGRFDRVI